MKFLLAAILTVGLAAPAGADTLQLSFDNGFVTLSAKNVPVRQILAEWARLGQTHVVNADRLDAQVTLELPHVPEQQALETLLRSAGGFLAASRDMSMPGLSRFDRIVVMPTAPGPPVQATAPPPIMQPPAMQPPVVQPSPEAPPEMVDDQDEPIPPPGIQHPGMPTPDQPNPAEEEGEDDEPSAYPSQGLAAPGIQPMPPGQVPAQGQPVQPGQPEPGEGGTPQQQSTGPVAVPGQGAIVSPAPGQLPMPPPQPTPR